MELGYNSKSYYFLPATVSFIFLLQIILAYIYANQRIYLDSSYYLFKVVNYQQLQVEHQRYILAFSQLLPWLGSQLHLPMKHLIVLHSLNYLFWWTLVLTICWVRYHSVIHILAIAFSTILGITMIWFSPMYEVWYAIPLIILVDAILIQFGKAKLIDYFLLFYSISTVLFAYPTLVTVLIFLFLYRRIGFKGNRYIIIFALATIIWLIIKYFFISDYELAKLNFQVGNGNSSLLAKISSLQFYVSSVQYLFSAYYDLVLIFILSIGILIFKGKVKNAALLICAFIFFTSIIYITHQPEGLKPIYERLHCMLIPIVLISFIEANKSIQGNKSLVLLALILVIGKCYQLNSIAENTFIPRYSLYLSYINKATKNACPNLIIKQTKLQKDNDLTEWSMSMELALISSTNEKKFTPNIVSDVDYQSCETLLKEKPFILRSSESISFKDLNSYYFNPKVCTAINE
ncbi:MAG: hypothetical protein SGJ04_07060 [Bacteroidota bacterium]|nr:hypothetical protein [Bacteroidota bacterium]